MVPNMWSLNVVLFSHAVLLTKFVSDAVLNPRAEKDGKNVVASKDDKNPHTKLKMTKCRTTKKMAKSRTSKKDGKNMSHHQKVA